MSFDASALPPLRDVINENGLRAEKAFGQNFLLDLNLTRKIARQASDFSGKIAVEIGPGPGGLTRALLESDADKVIAVEYDPRCIEALQPLEKVAEGRLTLIHADALDIDIASLLGAKKGVIAANLPYNIATPLLINWLRHIKQTTDSIDEMILMFQKEVGDRITAQPNSKTYGRLSVISQWLCHTQEVMRLPPSAFTPPPKIHSSVIRLQPRKYPEDVPFEAIETITAAAFGQRRKMIRQSLKSYTKAIEKTGIEPTLRAEQLSVAEFIKLAQAL